VKGLAIDADDNPAGWHETVLSLELLDVLKLALRHSSAAVEPPYPAPRYSQATENSICPFSFTVKRSPVA
jgi:hypothetical protein